jgi:radical SAM superfamily enzyme YgiQ (UPF0313 family)
MIVKLIKPAVGSETGAHAPTSRAFQDVALPLLAACTPEKHTVRLVDELFAPDDPDEPVDLVGISVWTELARRSYQIAQEYRDRGVKVVMGGIHPTMLPEEALQHCDAVVIGEGELIWPKLLDDAEHGNLQPCYRADELPCLERLPLPRRELYPKNKYRSIIPFAVGVESSRGCPYDCEFCSVLKVRGHKYRIRPVDEIIKDIGTIGSKYLVFVDDNMALERRSAKELFRRMTPLKRQWISEGNVSLADDPEMLRLMKASGCIGLQIGFETIQRESQGEFKKLKHIKMSYREAVHRFHDAGIAVMGNFVFGLDNDRPESFEKTLEFAVREKLDFAQFRELVPYPGTRLYNRLLKENRLVDPEWWLNPYRNFGDATPAFLPRHMTPEQLMEGLFTISREFYSYSGILKRFTGIKPWKRTFTGHNLYFAINWINAYRYLRMYRSSEASTYEEVDSPETEVATDRY